MKNLFICAVMAVLIAGCAEDEGEDGGGSKAPAEPKEVELHVNEDGERVEAKSIVVTGKVSPPGAEVQVADKEVTADGRGIFRARVGLPEVGQNTIFVDARKPGFESADETIYVTRELTAAQRAARAERRRQRREAELAELRASAEWLDPELFQKNPDRYIGQSLAMSGEIFQIQEGGGNFFLMDTACTTEYDITICDGPTVYVTYGFPTDKTEQDLVTVYGEAMGRYEYETQIGGSNYVGWIEGRIIE